MEGFTKIPRRFDRNRFNWGYRKSAACIRYELFCWMLTNAQYRKEPYQISTAHGRDELNQGDVHFTISGLSRLFYRSRTSIRRALKFLENNRLVTPRNGQDANRDVLIWRIQIPEFYPNVAILFPQDENGNETRSGHLPRTKKENSNFKGKFKKKDEAACEDDVSEIVSLVSECIRRFSDYDGEKIRVFLGCRWKEVIAAKLLRIGRDSPAQYLQHNLRKALLQHREQKKAV